MASSRGGDRVDFRGSSGKQYCKFCNAWIDGNPIALKHHREGNRHKRNVQYAIDRQRKEKQAEHTRARREQQEVRRMQLAAGMPVGEREGGGGGGGGADRGGGVSGGRQRRNNVCFAFQRGDCRRGSACKFAHEKEGDGASASSASSSSSSADPASALGKRDGGTGREGDELARREREALGLGEEGSDAEMDEDERRGMYVVDGRVYLEAARHPDKIVPGLRVEVAVGGEFDSDEEEGQRPEDEDASPWAQAVVAQVLVLRAGSKVGGEAGGSGAAEEASVQWRYRVRIVHDGGGRGDAAEKASGAPGQQIIRDALLEDMRVLVAPPPPPVDDTNRDQTEDAALVLQDKSTTTGMGGWEVVPADDDDEEEHVEEEREEEEEMAAVRRGGREDGGSSDDDGNRDRGAGRGAEGGGTVGYANSVLANAERTRTATAGMPMIGGAGPAESDAANAVPSVPSRRPSGNQVAGGRRSYAGFKLTAAAPPVALSGAGGLGGLGGVSGMSSSAVGGGGTATFKKRKKRREVTKLRRSMFFSRSTRII